MLREGVSEAMENRDRDLYLNLMLYGWRLAAGARSPAARAITWADNIQELCRAIADLPPNTEGPERAIEDHHEAHEHDFCVLEKGYPKRGTLGRYATLYCRRCSETKEVCMGLAG